MKPRVGCDPAHERLEAFGHAAVEADLRLVDDRELVTFERASEVRLECEPLRRAIEHVVGKDDRAGLARRLRPVHRDIGALRGLLGVEAFECRHDADARGDEDLGTGFALLGRLTDSATDLERRRQRALDALCRLPTGAQHDELVAALTGQQVVLGQAGPDPRRRVDQQLVADGVAIGIIDQLEAVQIDEEHDSALPLAIAHRVVSGGETAAVR